MKFYKILTGVLLLNLFFNNIAEAKEYKAKVLYNHNGDTLTVKINGEKERVRLIGIEAHKMGQGALAEEAQLFLEKLTKDKDVILETDIQERDQFGRLLAYVYLDKKLLNTEIVKEGFAKFYSVPPNVKFSDEISKAQISARTARKGIWYQKGVDGDKNNPNVITKVNKPYKSKLDIKRKLVHVNEFSKTYHKPGCKFYNCKNCIAYMAESVAISRGYKKCSQEH